MEPRRRLVHCFMQCGIGSGLVPYNDQDNIVDPVDITYKCSVLDIQPDYSATSFDPGATKEICMPNGVKFVRVGSKARPEPEFHSFVITREDGSQKYGGCLTYYSKVINEQILHSLQTLVAMYKEQLRCEKEPRFAFPLDTVVDRDIELPSPSTVQTDTQYYASQCIALVIELPFVRCIKRYLMQLVEYSQLPEQVMSIESYLHNLLYDVQCPSPGRALRVTAPLSSLQIILSEGLPLFDHPLEEVLTLIRLENFVDLFACVMLEHQVMLLSKDNQRLMLVAESLRALLLPFQWNHVYVPIVPTAYLHFIEAPVPFLMGLGSSINHDQADMCILDIDKDKLTLPEDLPILPSRDQLISDMNLYINSKSANLNTDPITYHTQDTQRTTIPPTHNVIQRKRPPRLNFSHLAMPHLASNEEERFCSQMLEFNSAIRYIYLDHICKIFLNYEKFIIFPRDKEHWEDNKDNEDNFERDIFLCDQPPQNLSFLSRFLETNMFSCFIDHKIASVFSVPNDNVTIFDTRVEHLKKMNQTEIMSPLTSEMRKAPVFNTEVVDLLCQPPTPRGSPVIGTHGHFPLMRSALLQDDSDKSADISRRKEMRQKTLKEAKAKFSATSPKRLKKIPFSPSTGDSFDKMMKAHADFTNQLLKDCKNKINRLLVLKMGPEAQGLGYDYNIRDVEENSMVGAICDLVERVWAHGLIVREGKSALWCSLNKHHNTWKEKHPQYSPSSTGSTSEDDSLDEASSRGSGSFFRSKPHVQPAIPSLISQHEELYNDITSIKSLRMIKTDTGRARAWIRLSIEKHCLQQYLDILTEDNEAVTARYKDYAFLRDEEKVLPFIKYLHTLSAVPFTCFTASFPNLSIHYKLYIVNSNKFNAQSTANPWILLSGQNGDTGVYSIQKGEPIVSIVTRNLGELLTLRVGHDNSGLSPGWCLDHILVENLLNGHCTLFRCACWLSRSESDGSIERLLVGERVHREEYRNHRAGNDRPPPVKHHYSTTQGAIQGQELLASAVNSLVKQCVRGHESEGTPVMLLCGPQGLVAALHKLLSCGMRPLSRFNRSVQFVWDVIYKVYLEMSVTDQCPPDPPARETFIKCVQLIQRSSSSIGKDGKFQTLICLGVREHMLHRWFYMMSQSMVTDKSYDHLSVFKQDAMVDEVMGLLKILEDLNIPVDTSLIQQTER